MASSVQNFVPNYDSNWKSAGQEAEKESWTYSALPVGEMATLIFIKMTVYQA